MCAGLLTYGVDALLLTLTYVHPPQAVAAVRDSANDELSALVEGGCMHALFPNHVRFVFVTLPWHPWCSDSRV